MQTTKVKKERTPKQIEVQKKLEKAGVVSRYRRADDTLGTLAQSPVCAKVPEDYYQRWKDIPPDARPGLTRKAIMDAIDYYYEGESFSGVREKDSSKS